MTFLKKYKFIYISSLSLLSFMISCEDLDPEDPNNFQSTEVEDANLFAVGMYQAYQKIPANEYLITELRSDNAVSDSGNGDLGNAESYNITPDYGEGSNYWANNYSVVLNANLIIENEDTLQDTAEGQKSLAEAYFMRALCHFNLVRTFQNVPYINAVIAKVEDLKLFQQKTEQETYIFLINDFNKSIDYFNSSGNFGEKNKANLGAAYGFLAKAFLSQPAKDYAAAYNILSTHLHPDTNQFGYALKEVDATDKSIGINQYLSIFQGDELNEEILFAVSYAGTGSDQAIDAEINIDDQVQDDAQEWSFSMTEEGNANGLNLSEDLLELLLINDDVNGIQPEPIRGGDRAVLEAGKDIGNIDGDDGLNFDDSDNIPGDSHIGTMGFEADQEGKFYDAKYRSRSEFSGIDAVVLRYADILLLFSESLIQGVDSQNLEAIQMYNRVRARVGASTLPEDGTAFLEVDELLDERRRELTFENHRLWDLIRFGQATFVLAEFSARPEYGFNFQPTDIYLPIPQREIDATGGRGVTYTQNDGYPE